MDHHGSETYFIPGEGYLGESVGGRETAAGFDARAAAADAAAAAPFRFSRMGPRGTGKQLSDASPEEARRGDDRRSRLLAGARRLHLPGAVHRPRPDV